MATREELEALKREDLNTVAEKAGVEDPESYSTKGEVVDAIIEAKQNGEDDDETTDDETTDDEEALHTSDAEARVEGVTPGDVEPDPQEGPKSTDAATYDFPPGGDVDVASMSDEELDGETLAPIPPDARVVLAESDDVPEEYWGHPALVLEIRDPDPDNEDEEDTVYKVRTRDEHNAILWLEREDFAEVHPGSVGVRGFGT